MKVLKDLMVFAVVGSLLTSCGSGTNRNRAADAPATAPTEEASRVMPSDSGVVALTLRQGEGEVRTCKHPGQTVYVDFDVKEYRKLTAHLTVEDSTANVRFNQITMPSGEMDGPFGRDMTYDLTADGHYRLAIAESLMAGDPWGGNFTVTVKLSD